MSKELTTEQIEKLQADHKELQGVYAELELKNAELEGKMLEKGVIDVESVLPKTITHKKVEYRLIAGSFSHNSVVMNAAELAKSPEAIESILAIDGQGILIPIK